jgi:hypothetical protein
MRCELASQLTALPIATPAPNELFSTPLVGGFRERPANPSSKRPPRKIAPWGDAGPADIPRVSVEIRPTLLSWPAVWHGSRISIPMVSRFAQADTNPKPDTRNRQPGWQPLRSAARGHVHNLLWFKSSDLNPQPSTPNPNSQTLNREPQTLNPKPRTPSTLGDQSLWSSCFQHTARSPRTPCHVPSLRIALRCDVRCSSGCRSCASQRYSCFLKPKTRENSLPPHATPHLKP